MAMPNIKLVGEYMTQLETPQAFWAFVYKMAARGHFVVPIDAKNHKVLVIGVLNGYGEYEFDWCICDQVMACTSVGVRRRRRRRRRRRNQKDNNPDVSKTLVRVHKITFLKRFSNLKNLFNTIKKSFFASWVNERMVQLYYSLRYASSG